MRSTDDRSGHHPEHRDRGGVLTTRQRPRGAAVLLALGLAGCGESAATAKEVPPCERECLDETAVVGLRETLKLVFNLTLQGNDAGEQDETTPCLGSGSARVFGTATSNAEQGAMEVSLTYVLEECRNVRLDEDADESYSLVLSGTVQQQGTIAVQPSATMALIMTSDDLSLSGTVYDPPLEFTEAGCALDLVQTGDNLSGTLCDRPVGVDL